MIFLQYLIIATISFAYISAIKSEDLLEQYREAMPERLKTFLTGLSDQERAVMEEVFMKNLGKYKSYEEVKAAVEAKSPELAAKLYQPTSWLDEKAAALGPEARAYYNAMEERARRYQAYFYTGKRPTDAELKQSMVEDVNGYRALSAAGKADFQKQFPVLAKFLGSDEFYKEVQAWG